MSTKNKGNDKILTVIFVVSILLGFYLVSVVNTSFENVNDTVVLFKTDSTTEFIDADYINPPVFATWDGIYNAYHLNVGGSFYNYTKSPVYLGNDTWTMSINGSAHSETQFGQYVIALPNMDDWIISDITINQTINTDTDLTSEWGIYSSATLNKYNYNILGEIVFDDDSIGALTDYHNETLSLDLSTALNVQDKASDGIQHYLVIRSIDKDSDGLGAWAWNIEVVIEGKQIATYNIQQNLNLALGIAITINVCVIVFMTDEIDIGGFVNDIPDKKRR